MSLDPIKIPQNVYIEDRIVGPLTLRQVITVAIGGGFSYALWSIATKIYGDLPLPIVIALFMPALFCAAFAFIRINDLSLMRIMLLMIEQMEKPSKRVWAPRQGIVINIRTFTVPTNEKKAPPKSNAPIDQITLALDASPFPKSSMMTSVPNADGISGSGSGSGSISASPGSEPEPYPDPAPEPSPEPATYRRPVNPERITAEPLRTEPGMDGIGTAVVIPRSSIFRDLSSSPGLSPAI